MLLLLASACDEHEADTHAEKTLSQAVERTVAADSFHIDTVATYEGEAHEAEVDYVAPDRIRLASSPPSDVSLYIGQDMYFSEPDDPDRFLRLENPCETTVSFVVSALAVVQKAEDVRLVGGTYVFSTGDPTVSGEARVEDGLLSSLVVRYEIPVGDLIEHVEERHRFSRFGDDLSIEAPAPEQVTHASGSVSAAPGVIVVDEGSPVTCQ
jgi:hypothetical protein